MRDVREKQDILRGLFKEQRLAVLATSKGGHPYSNLVAFAAVEDLRHLLFATDRSTRKYANITEEARVSLLIDDRSNTDADFGNSIAVTAMGRAAEVRGAERTDLLKVYLARHPQLHEFVTSPACALMMVHVHTYYLSGFHTVTELQMND